MTRKTGLAIALSGVLFVAGTALAQAPGGGTGSGSGSGTGSPGSGSPAMGTGNNPCPPGQTLDGKTCAPARVQPTEKPSMERMDKRASDMDGGRKAMGREHVKSAQEALKSKGYDPGEVDGAMGPRTSAALRDFQQAEGLRATGRLDSETRTKLGI
jgi:Putative peptidoglycan binding domain